MFKKVLHPRRRRILIRCSVVVLVVCSVLAWRSGMLGIVGDSNNTEVRALREDITVDSESGAAAVVTTTVAKDSNNEVDVDGQADHLKNPLEPPIPDLAENPRPGDAAAKAIVGGGADQQERDELERQIQEGFAKVVPGLGANGAAVKLSPEESVLADELMKKEAFNIIASDKITFNRTTPDNRHSQCKSIVYDDDLPSASVIIIFTNEAWSPLLRTVHTVLNYSPSHLLHEIILLDDFSDRAEMTKRLDYYVANYLPPKVKLIRAEQRLGLIRARLAGAKAATGKVLVFLDSHCEATTGWLEPLLQRIKENRHTVLLPIIDVIDDKTMEFYQNSGTYFQVGGFTWSGHFTWVTVPKREIKRRGTPIAPTRSPTMAGGLFAVENKFFWDIGGYDEGMDVWGGENLEISFRVWMCGGLLEAIPCSHVGHIFRSFHPYTFPGNKDTHGLNTARMAEVWMDDYKRLLYLYRRDLEIADYGDVTARKELRKKLKCTSFKWYLDNIFPEKFILDEDVFSYGRVSNKQNPNMCFDMLQRDEKNPYNLGLYHCHQYQTSSQYMAYSKGRELRREETCAEIMEKTTPAHVLMTPCHGKFRQKWRHTKHGALQHEETGKCVDLYNSSSDGDLWATDCNGSPSQAWSFDVYLAM